MAPADVTCRNREKYTDKAAQLAPTNTKFTCSSMCIPVTSFLVIAFFIYLYLAIIERGSVMRDSGWIRLGGRPNHAARLLGATSTLTLSGQISRQLVGRSVASTSFAILLQPG